MLARILAFALRLMACVLLVACVLMLLLIVVMLFPQVALSLGLTPVAFSISRILPAGLSMLGVVASPFGGVFRTDFVIVVVVMFVAAKILSRIAKGLS